MMLTNAQHAMTRTVLQLNLFLFALSTFFLYPLPTQAIGDTKVGGRHLPSSEVSAPPNTGSALSNVHVQDVLDLPVVQQPSSKPYYVSGRDGEATQFSMVSQYGNLGLLAHNTLSGRYFSRLFIGQEIRLMYEDGRTEYFVVTEILRFQALQPESVTSSFRNLEDDETLSAGELFNRAYAGGYRLVLQTCIEAKGNPSWGRLFVIAAPKH